MYTKNGEELLNIYNKNNLSLAKFAIQYEIESKSCKRIDVINNMRKFLNVMKESANEGQEKKCIM